MEARLCGSGRGDCVRGDLEIFSSFHVFDVCFFFFFFFFLFCLGKRRGPRLVAKKFFYVWSHSYFAKRPGSCTVWVNLLFLFSLCVNVLRLYKFDVLVVYRLNSNELMFAALVYEYTLPSLNMRYDHATSALVYFASHICYSRPIGHAKNSNSYPIYLGS